MGLGVRFMKALNRCWLVTFPVLAFLSLAPSLHAQAPVHTNPLNLNPQVKEAMIRFYEQDYDRHCRTPRACP